MLYLGLTLAFRTTALRYDTARKTFYAPHREGTNAGADMASPKATPIHTPVSEKYQGLMQARRPQLLFTDNIKQEASQSVHSLCKATSPNNEPRVKVENEVDWRHMPS